MSTIALAGKPNTGKTTIFNLLTGLNHRVANFPGCTVEKVSGDLHFNGRRFQIVDLPGNRSLFPKTRDERVSLAYIESEATRNHQFGILCIADAGNLKTDLMMAIELKALGYPVAIVINMIDEARVNGIEIDLHKLQTLLKMPIVGVSGKTGEGLHELKSLIATHHFHLTTPPKKIIDADISTLRAQQVNSLKQAESIISETVTRHDQGILKTLQRSIDIDRVLLNPVVGPLVFIAIMGIIFQFVFTISTPIIDWIDAQFSVLSEVAAKGIPIQWLGDLIGNGFISGIGAVLVFVPQIAILFLMIGLFERIGYLPRAAVLVDKLLQPFGLDGRVFIPLLSSFACAIPGIMAARTVDSEKKRALVYILSPLMTCSARLPVYTLVIATFVSTEWTFWGLDAQGIVMTGMYLFAILMAIGVGIALKYTRLYEPPANRVVQLPPYRMPNFKHLLRFVWSRTSHFIKRAGKVIFALTFIMWALATFPARSPQQSNPTGSLQTPQSQYAQQIETSYLGQLGQRLEPIFAPIGYDWKLSIGIIASFAAREVFVGTLGLIYGLGEGADESSQGLIEKLQREKNRDGSPRYTLATAVSLLLFFAISLQCVSTIAVIRRETGTWKWVLLQFVVYFFLAYSTAFVGYHTVQYLTG